MAANQIIEELIIQADKADSLGAVKKALKDIKGAMLAAGDEGGEDFKKLVSAAAQLKDKVEDANAAIERANPDKFNGLASAAKISATGIQLTTGAMALFGDESEDVNKALLKVQAAMAFSDALQSIPEIGKEFKKVWAVIAANPIIAILTAVIAIGTAAYKIYENYQEANSEAAKLRKNAEESKKLAEQQVIQADGELAIMQAQGATAFDLHEKEKEILEIKIRSATASLAAANATLLEARNSDSILESTLKTEASLLRKAGYDKQAAQMEAVIGQIKKDRTEKEEKAFVDAQNALDALKTEGIVSDAKYNKSLVDNAKAANDEKLKNEADALAKLNALKEENRRDNTDKDLLALQDYQAKQQDFYENGVIDASEYNKRIRESQVGYEQKKKDADDQAWQDAQDQADLQMQQMTEQLDAEIAAAAAANKKKSDDDKAAAKLKQQLNSDVLTATADLFGSLADLSKKNAKAQKGFAVGQAIINTYKGVSAALAQPTPLPLNLLMAAAALAAGLVQVRNIMNTKEDGGGGVSGGGGVGSPPQLSAINTSPSGVQPSTLLDANGNVIGQQPSQPIIIQAHMSETEVRSATNRINLVEQQVINNR